MESQERRVLDLTQSCFHNARFNLILLGAGIRIVEEALLPRALLEHAAWQVIALPLRLRGASGAPTRIVASALNRADG
jgi:kynurenine formamidase